MGTSPVSFNSNYDDVKLLQLRQKYAQPVQTQQYTPPEEVGGGYNYSVPQIASPTYRSGMAYAGVYSPLPGGRENYAGAKFDTKKLFG